MSQLTKNTVPVKDLRQVEVSFFGPFGAEQLRHDGSSRTYIVHESDVDTFVAALKKLHYEPGLNPHTRLPGAVLRSISVGTLEWTGPFWWTVPNLKKNDDPRGAALLQSYSASCVWMHPEYAKLIKADEARMDEEEARGA